jgi:hypothetical protein
VQEPDQDEEDGKTKLKILNEIALSSEEDAPMTLAVTQKVHPRTVSANPGHDNHRHKSVNGLNIREEAEQAPSDI